MKYLPMFLLLVVSFTSHALTYKNFNYGWTRVSIRMGTQKARRSDKATLIYFIGYSDRMENHEPLFRKLNRNGIRVISYDYPGHGGSGGWLSTWGIKASAKIVKSVIKKAKVDSTKPVILAGWSTGGLIATRIIQSWTTDVIPAKYDIGGAILIDPAIPAKVFVGNTAVNINGVTRGKILPPKPVTTYGGGVFTLSLGKESFQARRLGSLPNDIPVVVFLGDKDFDKYTKVGSTKRWIKSERTKPIWGFECPKGFHGLEFEPDGIGSRILQMTTAFAKSMASSKRYRIVNTKNTANIFAQQASACPAIK